MEPPEFPQLYALASTGKVKTWKIKVTENDDSTATVTTEHGYLDGTLQTKAEVVRTGKNLGKANETTPYQQALAEAQSDWQRKIDKKYLTEIPTVDNEPDILLPMLALPFTKRSHDIRYPAWAQPKLNGVRCLAKKVSHREIQFTSRKGKDFNGTTRHLVAALLEVMEIGEVFDGELYNHAWTFQQIIRTVKKLRPWGHELQFHIFDLADKTMRYEERWARLQIPLEFEVDYPELNFVANALVSSEAAFKEYHDACVKLGYEGAIIRNAAGLYRFDHRSKDLQKYKEFIDAEFEIVGGEAEIITDPITLKELEAVVFTCAVATVKISAKEVSPTFNVRPRGSVAERVRLFKDLPNLVGKQLTVRYQEFSEDNVPIFPVGLTIRDYE